MGHIKKKNYYESEHQETCEKGTYKNGCLWKIMSFL